MAARRVDWSFGPGHGPISGVVNAAAAAAGATMVGDLAHVSPEWGLVGGVVAATGATISSRWQNAPGRALFYRAGCWACAGGWASWALADPVTGLGHGPWSANKLAALAIGTVGAALAGLGFQQNEKREEQARQEAVEAEKERLRAEDAAATLAGDRDRIAASWQTELRRQTKREVKVEGVEFWNPNTGFTLDVTLPPDGTTIEDIKPHEKSLAHAMDVPTGCAVEVIDPGVARRVIHIRVGTVDAMAEDQPLPEGCEQDTIENPISLGIKSDRTEGTVNIRYNNMVLVGQVDSGKSNQLNVITRQLARCTDALIWAIDLTGNGRYPRPWVRAWHEGRAVAPAIDWVAPDAEEALLMTVSALAIIEGRTADYEHLMFEKGWDKIMVSPEIPEIIIITDEFGSLPVEVKENLRQISDTGRGAGVRLVSCALEATGTYIPRAMITQSRERVGMRVQDETQLQYLFDTTWRSGRFDMSTMRVRGSGLFSTDAAPPEKFKGWRIEPGRIDQESVVVGPWRPELDEASVARADSFTTKVKTADGVRVARNFTGVYTDRWKRTQSIIFPASPVGGAAPRPRTPEPAGVVRTAASPAAASDSLESSDESLAEKLAAARRAAAESTDSRGDNRGEVDVPFAEPDWGVLDSWLIAGAPRTDTAGKPKPPPRVRMRQLVWDAGDAGIEPGPVHKRLESEGYSTVYQTVRDWMGAAARDGILSQPGGKKTPYFKGPKMTDPYAEG